MQVLEVDSLVYDLSKSGNYVDSLADDEFRFEKAETEGATVVELFTF